MVASQRKVHLQVKRPWALSLAVIAVVSLIVVYSFKDESTTQVGEWKEKDLLPAEARGLWVDNWDDARYQRPGDIQVVVIAHSEWMGIRSATESMKLVTVYCEDTRDETWDEKLMRFVVGWQVKTVMINGFPPRSLDLARKLHSRGVKVVVVYHGSFPQHTVENLPEVNAFADILSGLDSGVISRIGLIKNEMVNVMKNFDLPAKPLSNLVIPRDSLYGIKLSGLDGRLHIGILGGLTAGKNVVTQLAAACSIENAVVHHLELGFVVPFAEHCRAELRPHKSRSSVFFRRLLSQMDINMYISLNECQPMVVLESLAAGVPCITSDTSVIFQSDPFLHQLLVCPNQDAADAILECLSRVVTALSPLLSERVRQSIQVSNVKAVQQLGDFLDIDPWILFGHRRDLAIQWNRQQLPIPKDPPNLQAPSFLAQNGDRDRADIRTGSLLQPSPCPLRSTGYSITRTLPFVFASYELAGANPGGAGTVIAALALSLVKAHIPVILLVDMPKHEAKNYLDSIREENIPEKMLEVIILTDLVPHPSDTFCGKAARWALGVEKLAEIRNFKAIEFFDYAAPASYLLARRYLGRSSLPPSVQIIIRLHGSLEFIMTSEDEPFLDTNNRMFFMERFAMQTADFIFTPTLELANLYSDLCHIQPQNLLLAAPPVLSSLKNLLAAAKNPCLRISRHQHHRVDEDISKSFKFLILGKIQKIKDPDLIVDAALMFIKENPSTNVSFTFVGMIFSPGLQKTVLASIPSALIHRFHFEPPVSRNQLSKLACDYDAAIIASRFESFNMVAHELTFLGMPLVISEFVAFTPYFSPKNAFVYKHRNVFSLRDALANAIFHHFSIQIHPLSYPDPLSPYKCIYARSFNFDHLSWWRSDNSKLARDLLPEIGMSECEFFHPTTALK